MTWNRHPRFLPLTALLAIVIAACGGGNNTPATPTAPTSVTIDNQTPCVVYVRFENTGQPVARIKPGERQEITDEKMPSYSYLKVESTMAIFRTYPMSAVRDNGSLVVIKPAIDDHPCFEQP